MRKYKSASSPVDRYSGAGSKMCRTAWHVDFTRRGIARVIPVTRQRRRGGAAVAGGNTRERRLDHPEEAHPKHQHDDQPTKHFWDLR